MLNNDSYPPCGILYVDDEAMALKYFRRTLQMESSGPKFKVFTAPSAREGLEILRQESAHIGIVLSDQKMPEMQGATFLGHVRQDFPYVVRILTTAYSDLESAIAAVNTGHIYQYIVKPWEPRDLVMVLRRASDYHHVLKERNELLSLKMTALQRILCSDRLKWLLLWSRSLSAPEQDASRRALLSLIHALPDGWSSGANGDGFSARQFNVTSLILSEYQNASRCADSIDAFRAGTGGAVQLPETLTAQIAGLAGTEQSGTWSPGRALKGFLAAVTDGCGIEAGEVNVNIGAPLETSVTIRPQPGSFDANQFIGKLFGLLVEREIPALSVRLFETLLAYARGGGSLTITLEAGGSTPQVFGFPLKDGGAGAEDVITGLYDKFESSDISRL
jgi:two-component system probable response regulator PhcQ